MKYQRSDYRLQGVVVGMIFGFVLGTVMNLLV